LGVRVLPSAPDRRLRRHQRRSSDRLTAIAHINDERAVQLIAQRPWPSVRSLTGINGIGRGRIRDILEQDLACVGVRDHAASARPSRVRHVLDGDTIEVGGVRVRLEGLHCPEG
jgi:endonuclease YncB( thermonuclease family)